MSKQKFPFLIEIYKGEGRILIIPLISHLGGYRVDFGYFVNIENIDCTSIGNNVLQMKNIIEKSNISCATLKEQEQERAWKKSSKYKTWNAFWKNNNFALFEIYEDEHYDVYSAKHSENQKGIYGDTIKKINLPPNATVEEIGQAVIDVFSALEEYYKEHPLKKIERYPIETIELLDGSF
ncbi:MAG: hypothetical protein MJ089_00745, partial [Ruminococcus sp.]|nr:hypothetical protein [Ruminococcus sp.]